MFSLRITCDAGPDGEPRNLRAMYRLASILSHDCTPNTKHTFDPDYGVNIYATVPIGNRTVFIMALSVMEFQVPGYKFRKIFA